MRYWQVIRIVLLLAAIFGAGVATGRLTTPRGPAYVRNAAGKYNTSETMLNRIATKVKLDAKQQQQFGVLLEELAEGMARIPPGTRERLQLFRESVPRQRALLRPEQYPAFDELVRQTERRFEQSIRRRND